MVTDQPAAAARRLAHLLRRLADRVDHHGAPKSTGLSFTFERGLGMVVNEEARGCRLWYLGNDEYAKAHTEAIR